MMVLGAIVMLVAVPLMMLMTPSAKILDISSISSPVAMIKTKNDNSSNEITGGCLDLSINQDMSSLVATARQVFVTMPAKAAGSSMLRFTKRCTKNKISGWDGFLYRDDQIKKFLTKHNQQSVLSSHIANDSALLHLAKYHNREMLLIYVHREESERVISGIKMISNHICKNRDNRHNYDEIIVAKNATHCILDEGSVLDKIAHGHREVGGGAPGIFTCKLYKGLQERAPLLVFLHYKQVDKLQMLLAKHHCQELLDRDELPIKANVSANKTLKILLNHGGTNESSDIDSNAPLVGIEEWLHAKGPALEQALNYLTSKASCQEKTSNMENALLGCSDGALRVTPASIAGW